jgi:predicted nuclease of predicted toxin-antitoxin system
MRILLDECLPARLRRELRGHDIQTVPGAGWDGVKNGMLLRLIAGSAAYDVFLTMDKNLPGEQKTADLPFAIVVLRARSNRFEDTRPLMPEVLRRLTEFLPGHVYVLTLLG